VITIPGMTQFDSQLAAAPTDHPLTTPSAGAPKPALTPLPPAHFFATPVWAQQLTAHATFNPPMLDALTGLEATAPSVRRSNVGGWHSETNLHHHPAFRPLCLTISRVALRCALALEFDFTRGGLAIQSLWANRNGPGDYNAQHVHPNSFLSGSYYLAVPPDSGNIEIADPVRERVMDAYPMRKDAKYHMRRIEYRCRDGLLIMFPSWLSHGVQPNRSNAMRYSLAFNIEVTPKILRP
tara:strand:- start:767 stop:1480 length:714 start_codon:yes stop_codon:yes gene_type:complete